MLTYYILLKILKCFVFTKRFLSKCFQEKHYQRYVKFTLFHFMFFSIYSTIKLYFISVKSLQ